MNRTLPRAALAALLAAPLASPAEGAPPVADWTVAIAGNTATFTDRSGPAGDVVSHAWLFGDGTSSTATNPVHTYATAGNYTVKETVADAAGLQSSKSGVVSIAVWDDWFLIQNGGFETGSPTPWVLSTGVLCTVASCGGEAPHAGNGFAWLGGYGVVHSDSAAQTFNLPAQVTSAPLTFWLHVDTKETGTKPYDKLAVQLLNAAGAVVATLATYSNVNAAPGYVQKTFDLKPWAGQKLTLRFQSTEDASAATSFVIDDVMLRAH